MFKRSMLSLIIFFVGLLFLGGGQTFTGAESRRLHVYLSAQSIEVVADWLGESEVMSVQVMSPEDKLVVDEQVSATSFIWEPEQGSPDGLYRYEVLIVAHGTSEDGQQNDSAAMPVSRLPGIFKMEDGEIIVPLEEGGGGPQSFRPSIEAALKRLSCCILHILVSDARADDLSASGSSPAVFFDNTTVTAQTNEWRIQAIGPQILHDCSFVIYDDINHTDVIDIAESPDNENSLFINTSGDLVLGNDNFYFDRSAGRMGIGTTVPQYSLHVASGGELFLDDSSINGDWQFNTGSNGLWFKNQNASPVKFEGGAPSDTLVIKNDGKVGLGTDEPSGAIEVARTGENVLFVVNRTDGARCGFLAKPNQFFIGTSTQHPVLIAAGNNWVTKFNTDGSLTMANGATCTAAGVWTDYCSRDAKENIRSLTAEEALDALGGLNPVRYNYRVDKEDECVGFIAEDVPDLVASKGRKGMSPMDIVAVLTKVVQEQQKINEEQQKTITELSHEVRGLKKILRLKDSVALADLE